MLSLVHEVRPKGCDFEPRLSHPKTGKLFSQASSKWVPLLNQRRIRQGKERDGLSLSYALPNIQWAPNLNCPYGYWAMGKFYFFFDRIVYTIMVVILKS